MNHIVLDIHKHSKRLLLATICCASFFVATAQLAVANKTFFQDRPTMLFSSVIADADTFIVLGVVTGVPSNTAKGMIGKIDNNIDYNYYKTIGDSMNVSYGLFWNSLIVGNENKLIFTGYSNDSLLSGLIGMTSKTLDTINLIRYYTNTSEGFQIYNILRYDNMSYYAIGGIVQSNNVDVGFIKVDNAGVKQIEKKYDQLSYDFGKSVVKLENGNLLIGAVRNNNNQTLQKSNTWLLEVDTGGNIVRQWFDPNDSTYVAEGLRQTQDGGFIYGAQKRVYQVAGSLGFTATVVKMDSNFNKQWVYEGGVLGTYTGVVDIEPLSDGGYVVCGNYSNKEAWVIKFTEAGQVVWLRKYMGLTDTTATWNLLSDIDVLPDGGFIAVGQCQRVVNPDNLTPQVGWFLKLDSNGCEVENCLVGIQDQSSNFKNQSELHVYPNPATGQVQIQVENEMLSGELKIYDVAGSLLLQKKIEATEMSIDVSSSAPGMYVVVAEKQGKVARSKLVVE